MHKTSTSCGQSFVTLNPKQTIAKTNRTIDLIINNYYNLINLLTIYTITLKPFYKILQ